MATSNTSKGSLLPAIAASLGTVVALSSLFAIQRKRQKVRSLSSSDSEEYYISAIRGKSTATGTMILNAYGGSLRRSPPTEGEDDDERKERPLLYVVTGATSGLGLQTARHLASLPRRVYIILGCRNAVSGGEVATELNRLFKTASSHGDDVSVKSSAECMFLDLTSFASTKKFAREVIQRSQRLRVPIHGLVNNAGVYDIAGTTDDGYQTTFQTNTLAPAYLTELLLPHTSNDFRMVNVSSEMAKMVWNSTRKEGRAFPPVDGGDGMWDYALSKACQGLHAHGLNLRWAAENEAAIASEGGHDVVLNRRRAFAVEPGIVNTGISRHMQSWTRKLNYLLLAPIVRTLDEGTSTILFCLLAPRELLEDKGAEKDELGAEPFYYGECMAKPPPRCCQRREDAELQDKLFKDIFLPLGSYICKGINRVDQT